jgi:hypothetical protein
VITSTIGKLVAIVVLAASSQAGCQSHAPKIQNQNVQDVSAFPRCTDEQGHGADPCVTLRDNIWIIWVDGIKDCPAITKQPKDQVKCLNKQK